MLKSYNEMRAINIKNYTETRDGLDYLNWAKCVDLLRENGAENVYFEPLKNELGSSLFKTDLEFKDSKGNTNRCYEVGVKVYIDNKEYIFTGPLMNGANPVKDNSLTQQRVWNCQTRLFVKCVAIHTGLGFDLWLKEEKEISKFDKNDDLNIHDLFKIKERTQIIYTKLIKKGLSTKEIAEKLNKSEDEVKALFSYYDTLSNFEKELMNLDK